jgi:hypothetical protein
MSWYFLGGILFLIALVLLVYYYRKELWKLQEGFQTLEYVAMCNLPENANSTICSLPDDPEKLPPETTEEIDIYDRYEKKNIPPPPPFKPTFVQKYTDDTDTEIAWDHDNRDLNPNDVLWGFVHPICSQEIYARAKILEVFGSISNFNFDESGLLITYRIPIFNNIEVSGEQNIKLFKLAEFLVNFAAGTIIELAWDKTLGRVLGPKAISSRFYDRIFGRGYGWSKNVLENRRFKDLLKSRSLTASRGILSNTKRLISNLVKPIAKQLAIMLRTFAIRIGIKIATKVAVTQGIITPPLAVLGPPGWAVLALSLVWTIAVVIIIPVLMAEYIPADGRCPPNYAFNLEDKIREKSSQVVYEVLVNIPFFGDILSVIGPYLCFNDKLDSRPKINYEIPKYYHDSSLSIYGSDIKPMVPQVDPAFNDYRQYYEIEGYNYNIPQGSSMTQYLDGLKKAADLNGVTKKAPPIFVDFTHEEMLNKMAEYYYKTSRRLPYTNYDGSLSFEYITKIYGVVASTQYTCDIQCEITRDIIYPNTGVLKSRVIVPPDKMGNTYHDRRFYFFVDKNDDLHDQIINDNRIRYFYKSTTSNKPTLNLPIRNNSLYNNQATNWDILMADNRARYIITGCTSINYTAPTAGDSPLSGYVGDIIVAVANPGSMYFNPTLSIKVDNISKIPDYDSCQFARSRNISSKNDAIPMQSISRKTDNNNVATLYDGTFFGKNLRNQGMTIFQLTLKNNANQLTFGEIIDNKLRLEYTLVGEESQVLQSDLQKILNIGFLVRIRATLNNQYISFDATIDTLNTSLITLTNVQNIKGGELFNLNGTATTLTDGILLYSESWGSNTKQWKYATTTRTSDKDLSIIQSVGFATLAQAPGLGLGYQFVGGMTATALDMFGVTNMLACTYQDMKQEGTYVINGNIITSSTTYKDDATSMGGTAEYNYFINRGPTIVFSPGYTPSIFRGVDKCSGLTLIHNDCINRYNIRVAINKYQSYNINKRIKRISNIKTLPANNKCVYNITTTEYDRYTGLDTNNTSKEESVIIDYIINTDTCAFVANNISFITPPSSTDPIIPSDVYNRVTRNIIPIATDLKFNIYKAYGCKMYQDTIYRCGSYKIRAPIFNLINDKYGENIIDPDTINKTKIGSVNIIQNAPINSQTTISQRSAFSLDYQVLLFENPTTKYRFEAIHQNIVGNNIIVQNIDIIYPLVVSVSTFITASGSGNNITINGDVPTWLQRGVTLRLIQESTNAILSLSNTNISGNNIILTSPSQSSNYKIPMIFNLNKNVIDFTIINAIWLKEEININISLDDNTSFNADVLSYVDNIVQITPSVLQNITLYTNTITLRYNYKATIIYDKKYAYNSSSRIHISNGAIIFPGNKPDWLQTDSYVKILLDNNVILYGRVQNPNPGTISIISSDMGSYYTRNIVIMGNTLNKTIIQIPKESRLLVNKFILVTNIQSTSSPQEIQITSIDLITNLSFTGSTIAITADVPSWLQKDRKIEIYSNPAGILVYNGNVLDINGKNITLASLPSSTTNGSYKINISDQTILTLNGNINSNSEQILFRLKDNEWTGVYDVYTIMAYGVNDTNDVQNTICTYNTSINIPSQPTTDSFSVIITPNDNNICLYDIVDDNIPGNAYNPIVPRPGNYIELPAPIPSYVYLPAITGCNGTSYRDCSGIDIITRLVDKYNRTHPDSKILKVLRAYSLTNQCEYQVEISRKIPYSRDRMIKKEALRFNMVSNQCKYEYTGEPIKGAILMIEPDPYSGTPDIFAINPPYIWSTSLIDRYRRFVNEAISMYQSMTPTWSSILDNTSQTAENRMKGIFNEIYSNRTLGNCSQLTCRDNDTLTKYVKQYNYDNYPSYTAEEQYGYMQRSIIQIRRGGLGGTLTQCHVELIEKQDYYEDYTLPPVQSDDPNKARFNTKYFLRQYQYDIQIANCVVSGVVALTKDDINKNLMDISSNPFGIQSDVSIVQFTPESDMILFNLGEFYSTTFLNNIARIYNDKVVNPTAPDKKNSITYFKNAFVISPNICEYQIVINRNIYSDEYGIWVPTDEIDGYIWVKTELPRVITSANIGEIYLMDVNFRQEGDTYIPRDSNGNILKMPYMFYADLTNTTSRVVGLSANGIPGPPNVSSSGYRPT